MNLFSLQGRTALVTGAAQGIGRGIALRLAKDGADIAIVDINTEKMAEVAGEIEELGRKSTTFKADVSNRAEVYAAVKHAEKTLGGLLWAAIVAIGYLFVDYLKNHGFR